MPGTGCPVYRYTCRYYSDRFPGIDTVPANLLKMQVVFDQPMRKGVSSQYLRWTEDGVPIESLFLELSPELWNSSNDTLTLWLNPGRIKRDLQPNLQQGNPLKVGHSYHLSVLSGWPAENGKALTSEYRYHFLAGEYDTLRVDPGSWQVKYPQRGSRDALLIITNEQLDLYAITNGLQIEKQAGTQVKGEFRIGEAAEVYFKPVLPWEAGDYHIYLANTIEDLAGNRQDRLFDEDLNRHSQHRPLFDKISFSIE